MQTLVDYIGNHSAKPVIKITAKEENATSLTSNKFGGYPYWPSDLEYPCNNKTEKMLFLAQINFHEVRCDDEHLPQTGILQFFITSNDLYGQNFDDHTEQSTFRVFYHEEINPSVTLQSVKAMGIRANTDLDPTEEAFTQEDPRGTKYTLEEFDTLLLQIDPDCKYICWGTAESVTFSSTAKR